MLRIVLFLQMFLMPMVSELHAQKSKIYQENDSAHLNMLSTFFLAGRYPLRATTKEELEYTNTEASDTTAENFLSVGGALRFNYIYARYDGEVFPLGTALRNDFTFDTWRLNVEARRNGIYFSFEYRFYPTFNAHFIHHGWLGYNFSDRDQLQVGVSQVPFGNLKYASHYNDYTYMRKHNAFVVNGDVVLFEPTQQNVLGALITAGGIYTYIDLAMGQNHPWITNDFGGTALGAGNLTEPNEPAAATNLPDKTPDWNMRFNINLGYYF